jgi:tetratricopeptide (TPR) repeat protein
MTVHQTLPLSLQLVLQQALAHHRAGRLPEAEQLYRTVLQAHPDHAETNHNLGVLASQGGQHAVGLTYLRAALAAQPSQEHYWIALAEALLASGQAKAAQSLLQQAVQHGFKSPAVQALRKKAKAAAVQNPTVKRAEPSPLEMNRLERLFNDGRYAEVENRARRLLEQYAHAGPAWKFLGVSLQVQGKSGLAALQRSAELLPNDAESYLNLGHAQHGMGQSENALASYRRALQINPDYVEAHNSLGSYLKELGQPENALASYRRVAEINPDVAEAHNNLGILLKELEQPENALTSFRRALEVNPDLAGVHNNLGAVFLALEQPENALASYRRALEIAPELIEAHSNLGHVLKEQGQPEEALASYRRALKIKPDFLVARYGLGYCLMALGQFSEGWQEFEYRWDGSYPKMQRPPTSLPQWTGQHAPQARLLVFGEQGWGDKLQFARYLPLAAERFAAGGGVSFVVDNPLLALFRRSFPGIRFLDACAVPADQSPWQFQCPLLSLPHALGTTLETIPQRVPYLLADPERVAAWQARIADLELPPRTRKIGVVWKKGGFMKNSAMYSIALQQLAPLLNLPGCAWFSLQKEADPDKAPWVNSGQLIDWADAFGDFDETAALAANLDLVVSVDTAVAHLAGGLGRPVWLLNRHASDWRWLHRRDDSPWYPTMRIFTQDQAGVWETVVERVVAALAGSA